MVEIVLNFDWTCVLNPNQYLYPYLKYRNSNSFSVPLQLQAQYPKINVNELHKEEGYLDLIFVIDDIKYKAFKIKDYWPIYLEPI